MKRIFKSILKYIAVLLIVLIVICIISVIVSKIYDFLMSNVFYYAAMISFIVAFLSTSGTSKRMSDSYRIHSVSASSNSIHDTEKEDIKQRDSKSIIMVSMTIVGIFLMIISNILAKSGL